MRAGTLPLAPPEAALRLPSLLPRAPPSVLSRAADTVRLYLCSLCSSASSSPNCQPSRLGLTVPSDQCRACVCSQVAMCLVTPSSARMLSLLSLLIIHALIDQTQCQNPAVAPYGDPVLAAQTGQERQQCYDETTGKPQVSSAFRLITNIFLSLPLQSITHKYSKFT